jgi:hypothetical protein
MIVWLDATFTQIETGLLGGPTWAMDANSFWDRALFFLDTGAWPGAYSRAVTEMLVEADVLAELNDGRDSSAQQKLTRAQQFGLNIVIDSPDI